MSKLGKYAIIGFIVIVVMAAALVGSYDGSNHNQTGISKDNQKTYEEPLTSPTPESNRVTKADLMAKNNPTIKRLNFATADYVGKSFPLYVMATVSDYYNYGFRDETKYYSLTVWDVSVDSEYDGTYAYIDKTKPGLQSEELLNKLLNDNLFLKVDVSIPAEKYTTGGNSFLEINNWEELKD